MTSKLDESFETAKREQEWIKEMEKVIEQKKKAKCLVCDKEDCTCVPAAAMNTDNRDEPYDCGSGV